MDKELILPLGETVKATITGIITGYGGIDGKLYYLIENKGAVYKVFAESVEIAAE